MNHYCQAILLVVGCLVAGCMSFPGHNLVMGGHGDHDQKTVCPVSKGPITITETTLSTVYKNKIYYFKDDAMRQMFVDNPTKYIDESSSNQESSQMGTYLLLGLGALVMWAMMAALKP